MFCLGGADVPVGELCRLEFHLGFDFYLVEDKPLFHLLFRVLFGVHALQLQGGPAVFHHTGQVQILSLEAQGHRYFVAACVTVYKAHGENHLLVYILSIEVERFQLMWVRQHEALLLLIPEPAVQLSNGKITHQLLVFPRVTEDGLFFKDEGKEGFQVLILEGPRARDRHAPQLLHSHDERYHLPEALVEMLLGDLKLDALIWTAQVQVLEAALHLLGSVNLKEQLVLITVESCHFTAEFRNGCHSCFRHLYKEAWLERILDEPGPVSPEMLL